MSEIDEIVKRVTMQCIERKEEILQAFVAKYGFDLDRIVQVEQRLDNGTIKWIVKHLDDIEYTEVTNLKRRVKDLEYDCKRMIQSFINIEDILDIGEYMDLSDIRQECCQWTPDRIKEKGKG